MWTMPRGETAWATARWRSWTWTGCTTDWGYGSLEVLDVDRMYYGLDWMVAEDPYAVSLANAVNEMNKNAREIGAAFVTFPSYTVEVIDGEVVTTASAVAVKLVDYKAEPVVEEVPTVAVDATVDVQ